MQEYKIKIPDAEVSRHVQEKAFELGYKWSIGRLVSHENSAELYFKKEGDISQNPEPLPRFFNEHYCTEISWQNFLQIGDSEIEQPQQLIINEITMNEISLRLAKAPKKAKNLTVGSEYVGIYTDANDTQVDTRKEAKYFYCVNNAGNEARYDISLFDEPQVARPVALPPPPLPTLNEIIQGIVVDDTQVVFHTAHHLDQLYERGYKNQMAIAGVSCSCGIQSVDGLDNLWSNLEELLFEEPVFANLTPANMAVLRGEIFKKLIWAVVINTQALLFLFSTATDEDEPNVCLLMDELCRESGGTILPVGINPNSSNEIASWVLVNPTDFDADDEDDD